MGVEIPFNLKSGSDSDIFMRAFYLDAGERYGVDAIRIIDYNRDPTVSDQSSILSQDRRSVEQLGIVIDINLNGSLIAAASDVLSFLESYRALGFIDVREKDIGRVRALANPFDLELSEVVGYEKSKTARV